MLELSLSLQNQQVSVSVNSNGSHLFSLSDLDQSEKQRKEFFENPRPYGGKLFQALFKDGSQARKEFDELSKQTERTIVLVLELSELDGIAWEYAYHDNAYIVDDFAFIRALPEKERPHSNGRLSKSVERVPLLFIPANPLMDLNGKPMQELDIESEWREMTQHITKSNAPFDLIELRPATPAALQSVMARFQNGMIAHFSGHGAATKDGAFLLFENENGASNPLEAREFVREVKDQAWIGFLSACQSAVAERTAFGNLARELVKAGVPFSLGMQFNLPDPFAPNISGQFYNYLSQGHAVPEAVRQARRAVKRENEFYVGMIALYAAHPDEAGKMGWTGSGARTVSTFAEADVSDLPTPSRFIGRHNELMNIGTKLLEKKKPNTVTLHGAGGIGKTALMRQALLRFAPSFELALAIALDPLPSLESVLGRLERFLKLPSPCANETKERETLVRNALTSKRTLLGLDNFETLNYALNDKGNDEEKTAKSLHSFFKYLAAEGVTLCVTSREVTNLPGETIEDIQGLTNKNGGRLFQDNVVRQKDEIYIEKAQQISELVGGHPLALRLLAASFDDQVGTSLDQYIEDLQSHLPKARDKWTEEGRHESLRASFDFTMNNLLKTEEGKNLEIALSRLSVFIAFFVDFTAARVLENKMYKTEEEATAMHKRTSSTFDALWERGLLERAYHPFDLDEENFYLYRLHPTLRVFAKERLIDAEMVQDIYLKSMNELAKVAEEQRNKHPLIMQIVLRALPDLQFAAELGTDRDSAALLYSVGLLFEQFGLYDSALQLLSKSRDINTSLSESRNVSIMLFEMANIYVARGEYEKGDELYKQSLEIFEEIGDLQGKSHALREMGYIVEMRGEARKAMGFYQQALEIDEKLNDLRGKSATLRGMGSIARMQGDLEKAMEFYKSTLEIDESLNDLQGKGATLHNMGVIYYTRRELSRALEFYQRSLEISDGLGDLKLKSSTLHQIGSIYAEREDLDRAMDFYKKTLEIDNELGNLQGKSTTLHSIANIYVKRGDLDAAISLYQQSLEIEERLGDQDGKITTLANIANLISDNDPKRAISIYVTALNIAQGLQLPFDVATINRMMSDSFIQLKEYQKALECLLDAFNLFIDLQSQPETNATVSHLQGMRRVVGEKGFDLLWQQITHSPLPDWLSESPEQEQGVAVEQFITGAIQSARERRPEAEQYFKAAQEMASDSNAPAELQSLGKVLQRILIGEKNVDLSALTSEFREMVEKALEG